MISRKIKNTIFSAIVVLIPSAAFLFYIAGNQVDNGGYVPVLLLIGCSLCALGLAVNVISAWISKRAYDKSGFVWVFTGILDFAVGMTFFLFMVILHRFPSSIIFTIPFILNLVIGLAVIIDVYFSKGKNSAQM